MKYMYTISNNKVVCVSHFAKKAVRGIAKCDTSVDTFDVEVGKDLALKRCDVKITEKRVKRAKKKLDEAAELLLEARRNMINMTNYYNESVAENANAVAALNKLEESLK